MMEEGPEEPSTAKNVWEPIHVVGAGSAVVLTGALLTATLTYRSGTKDLAEDGINPAARLRIIPLAARTLALSTLLTGALGVAGFYVLREQGFFRTDRAELPSAKEAARLLRDPKVFFKQLLKGDQGEQAARAARGQEDLPPS
ncbi:hypothetical protein TSOC_003571 [Tetrabaena socialis]|uniref:Transmembrane protein 242 n=1 Tax=Tetrabaena socialis TaxID=47790 RepID=A0A2J8AB63_9CHLO|nr:hypothetical protein TSOC_003571 [Tetrabaena socialis]|eukprot:PNH09764.1 hypothetical protein TSOC_003571 [Tetrabaena socialis]